MNTLTIPHLDLFHGRRTSIHQPSHDYIRYDHTHHNYHANIRSYGKNLSPPTK